MSVPNTAHRHAVLEYFLDQSGECVDAIPWLLKKNVFYNVCDRFANISMAE